MTRKAIAMNNTGTMVKAAVIGTIIGLLIVLAAENSMKRNLPERPWVTPASGACGS
jgi:hypothetical protein